MKGVDNAADVSEIVKIVNQVLANGDGGWRQQRAGEGLKLGYQIGLRHRIFGRPSAMTLGMTEDSAIGGGHRQFGHMAGARSKGVNLRVDGGVDFGDET